MNRAIERKVLRSPKKPLAYGLMGVHEFQFQYLIQLANKKIYHVLIHQAFAVTITSKKKISKVLILQLNYSLRTNAMNSSVLFGEANKSNWNSNYFQSSLNDYFPGWRGVCLKKKEMLKTLINKSSFLPFLFLCQFRFCPSFGCLMKGHVMG